MAESDYFDRELSWIEFNARVLHEAGRTEIPLMERLSFLAIVASNFDEFFQVRVASIKRRALENTFTAESSFSPQSLLKKISQRCHEVTAVQYDTLTNTVLPALAEKGIRYVNAEQYTASQKSYTEALFHHDIFPLLTPLRTDAAEFPHIGNLRLHVAFLLEQMPGVHTKQNPLATPEGSELVALVPLPKGIPRVVWLPSAENEQSAPPQKNFTVLDDIIVLYGTELFPGYLVKETMLFKVARDADFAVDEEAGSNFIQAMEEVLVKRQSSFAVCLMCNASSQKLLRTLQTKLQLHNDDVYCVNGLIDPSTLLDITSTEGAEQYRYPHWHHFYPDSLPQDGTYWNTLRQHDVLLHVPYESYEPVVRFVQDAAKDPSVLAIKITLYRTGADSPIVQALKQAAQNGKQVTAFVELKARFDEARNISWAEELEKAGAIVVYGVVNLKVHAKICLVVRRESDGLRRYVHMSTGNYNPKTARLYQDFSVFTSNPELATDATLFFNVISGYSALQPMHHLYMAPVTLKSRLIELIDREIKQSTPETPGLIMAKMNSLCHKEIIDKLYEASRAGVRIMLNVRGICTLIPGVNGMSQNIRVVSVIDRYLEHSRIFYFQNGGAEELYLSSADWMERNLDRRIELMFPVLDSDVFRRVKDTLQLYFSDNCHSHVLQSDGTWCANSPQANESAVRVQEKLYQTFKKREEAKRSAPKQEFVVRRKD